MRTFEQFSFSYNLHCNERLAISISQLMCFVRVVQLSLWTILAAIGLKLWSAQVVSYLAFSHLFSNDIPISFLEVCTSCNFTSILRPLCEPLVILGIRMIKVRFSSSQRRYREAEEKWLGSRLWSYCRFLSDPDALWSMHSFSLQTGRPEIPGGVHHCSPPFQGFGSRFVSEAHCCRHDRPRQRHRTVWSVWRTRCVSSLSRIFDSDLCWLRQKIL